MGMPLITYAYPVIATGDRLEAFVELRVIGTLLFCRSQLVGEGSRIAVPSKASRTSSLLHFQTQRAPPFAAKPVGADLSAKAAYGAPQLSGKKKTAERTAKASCGKNVVDLKRMDQTLLCPIRQAIWNAWAMAPTFALPLPAMSNAVPWAGVVIGIGRPPCTVTPREKPISLIAICPWS